MIGLVALIVAVVILVFFGIGYLLGRAFPVEPDLDKDLTDGVLIYASRTACPLHSALKCCHTQSSGSTTAR